TVNGCTGTGSDSTKVAVNSGVSIPILSSNSPACSGTTLKLYADTVSGAIYSWTGPNGFTSALQNPVISNAVVADSGTYTVTLNNGCAATPATIHIQIYPAPALPVVTSNSPLCVGSTLNLTTGTVAGATYTWTGPDGFTSALQNPALSNILLADTGAYSVTVTLGTCTSSAGSSVVHVHAVPATPTATSASPVCSGNTLNLHADTIAGATYRWTGPNGFTDSIQNPAVLNTVLADSGSYSVTVTIGGCSSAAASTSATVKPTPATPVISSNSPVCAGTVLNLSITSVTGATYSWSGPNSFSSSISSNTIPNATVAATGTYSVMLTLNGCNSTAATFPATVNPLPVAPVLSSNSPVCAGQAVLLHADTVTGATYNWTGPNGYTSTTQNPSIAGSTAADSGFYFITVTLNGCTSKVGDSTKVAINSSSVTAMGKYNTPLCNGTTLLLTANTVNGVSYSWTGPNGFTSSTQNPSLVNVVASDSGTYTLTMNNGCASNSAQVAVHVLPLPVADFKFTVDCKLTQADFQDASTMSHGTIQSWKWQFGDSLSSTVQNTTHTYGSAGTYLTTLTVKSDSGCMASRRDTVVIPHCSEAIVNPAALPTAFTPNGDGHNDIFFVRGGPFTRLDFMIYNNWGNLIFHSTSQNSGWDGTYNGALQPGGTYVWVLTGETIDNRNVKMTGNVTLIR
ncbi:MAG: PKD domain-containing protein, partial [Bacteroidia bacterium]